jgi:hypothetical protein
MKSVDRVMPYVHSAESRDLIGEWSLPGGDRRIVSGVATSGPWNIAEPLQSGSVQTDCSPPSAQAASAGVGRRSHRADGFGTVPQGRSVALADRYARRRYWRHPRARDAACCGLSRHAFIVTDHALGLETANQTCGISIRASTAQQIATKLPDSTGGRNTGLLDGR